ncbi:hypothetical protein AKJ58_01120 [candidate division MSBL1 archaeon SCGC-AAA385D11]|uniref:Uncharacterized protein n=1 Tax=candidate division MSBL1 archaeon SCGC-AAA385D11 TaxID=1698286 RepID=A0A133VNK5_9EURY|nr:hypothetical protein AKJ58_01120 [candidate division MSBL1 archaeon SCGC-AAA385D11]
MTLTGDGKFIFNLEEEGETVLACDNCQCVNWGVKPPKEEREEKEELVYLCTCKNCGERKVLFLGPENSENSHKTKKA